MGAKTAFSNYLAAQKFWVKIFMELKHAQNRSFDWFEKYSSYFELDLILRY
jgi:hypothetical protein